MVKNKQVENDQCEAEFIKIFLVIPNVVGSARKVVHHARLLKTSSCRHILLQVNELCKSYHGYISCLYSYYSIEFLNRRDKFISLSQKVGNNFLSAAKKR